MDDLVRLLEEQKLHTKPEWDFDMGQPDRWVPSKEDNAMYNEDFRKVASAVKNYLKEQRTAFLYSAELGRALSEISYGVGQATKHKSVLVGEWIEEHAIGIMSRPLFNGKPANPYLCSEGLDSICITALLEKAYELNPSRINRRLEFPFGERLPGQPKKVNFDSTGRLITKAYGIEFAIYEDFSKCVEAFTKMVEQSTEKMNSVKAVKKKLKNARKV